VTGGTIEGVFSSVVRFNASGARDAGAPCDFGFPRLAVYPLGRVVAAGTFRSPENPTARLGIARFDLHRRPVRRGPLRARAARWPGGDRLRLRGAVTRL